MPKSIFDIVGPIMIGPSSSHTAGALRLARIAKLLFNRDVRIADLYLHGSFRETYCGHGTDKALVAGLLGFDTDDERIRDAFKWAAEKGLTVRIHSADLGSDVHPNTVQIVMYDSNYRSMTVRGSSVGGGRICVTKINGYDVNLNGEEHIVVISGLDRPGVIAEVAGVFARLCVNIGIMQVSRKAQGESTLMTIEIDNPIGEEEISKLMSIENVNNVIYICPI